MKHRQHFEDTIEAIRREGDYRVVADIIPVPVGNQVEPFSLPVIGLVDRSEFGFLSHCYPPYMGRLKSSANS
jgi:hypothetical protein